MEWLVAVIEASKQYKVIQVFTTECQTIKGAVDYSSPAHGSSMLLARPGKEVVIHTLMRLTILHSLTAAHCRGAFRMPYI